MEADASAWRVAGVRLRPLVARGDSASAAGEGGRSEMETAGGGRSATEGTDEEGTALSACSCDPCGVGGMRWTIGGGVKLTVLLKSHGDMLSQTNMYIVGLWCTSVISN